MLSRALDYVVSSGDPDFVANVMELSACIIAQLDDAGPRAARLVGAAETIRQRAGIPIAPSDAALLEQFLAAARAAVAPEEWAAELAAGAALTQEQAVTLLKSVAQAT